MRRFFEGLGVILFVLLILLEMGDWKRRKWLAWVWLIAGAVGGVVWLVWKAKAQHA